jgi:trehalose transport system substrate-binding protein
MEPLDEMIASAGYQIPQDSAIFYAGFFERTIRFLPFRLRVQALIYNADEFPEPPKNWDSLYQWAYNHPGRLALKGRRSPDLTFELLAWLWGFGGDPLQLNSRNSVKAMSALAELNLLLHPNSRIFDSENILEAQIKGDIGAHLNWSTAMIELIDRGVAPLPMRSAPIPEGPQGNFSPFDGSYLAIPQQAPHPDEALAMIMHLQSDNTQAKLLTEYGYIPVTPMAWTKVSPVRSQAFEGFMAMANRTKIPPDSIFDPRISIILQDAFQAVVFEEKPLEPTLQKAAEEMAQTNE